MDLVEKENLAVAGRPQALTCTREYLTHVFHGRRNRRELLEGGAGRCRDDACERRLPRAGRAVEDRGPHAVLRDRETQRGAFAEHVLLPDELVQRSRAEPQRERRNLAGALRRRVGEEVGHAASMLRTWPRQACARR